MSYTLEINHDIMLISNRPLVVITSGFISSWRYNPNGKGATVAPFMGAWIEILLR